METKKDGKGWTRWWGAEGGGAEEGMDSVKKGREGNQSINSTRGRRWYYELGEAGVSSSLDVMTGSEAAAVGAFEGEILAVEFEVVDKDVAGTGAADVETFAAADLEGDVLEREVDDDEGAGAAALCRWLL